MNRSPGRESVKELHETNRSDATHTRIPLPGQPGHDAMVIDLQRLFDTHQQTGKVTIEYQTNVFLGQR